MSSRFVDQADTGRPFAGSPRSAARRVRRSSSTSSTLHPEPGSTRSARRRIVAAGTMRRMTIHVRGVRVPSILYGTAWKEARPRTWSASARRGVPGHRHREPAQALLRGGGRAGGRSPSSARAWSAASDLFLQTKFTYRDGQDHRLPYDRAARRSREQVEQSFASSLEHLGIDQPRQPDPAPRPLAASGLAAEDREVWRAMERIADAGRVQPARRQQRHRGPARARWSQRRAGARVRAEPLLRRATAGIARCARSAPSTAIVYQGFSLLTANRARARPARGRRDRRAPRPDARPRSCSGSRTQVGMLPLTGTSDRLHMGQDLAAEGFNLDADELVTIDGAGAP